MLDQASSTEPDLAAKVAALEAEVAGLRGRVERLEPPTPRLTRQQAELLLALARRLRPGETFLVRDVLKLAAGDPRLAALVDAVAAPGERQSQRLGLVFRAMADIPAEGLVLRRVAADEHGRAIWTIALAAAGGLRPDRSTLAAPRPNRRADILSAILEARMSPSSIADAAHELEGRQELQTAFRYIRANALARPGVSPVQTFQLMFPRSVHQAAVERAVDLHLTGRGAVAGGTSGTWAAPLQAAPVFSYALAKAVRQKQAIGRIPGAASCRRTSSRPIPAVGPRPPGSHPKPRIPLSAGAFAGHHPSAAGAGRYHRLLERTAEGGRPGERGGLPGVADQRRCVTTADAALLDPNQAGEPDVSPPSITFGAYTVPSTGPTLADLNSDLGALATHMQAQGVPLAQPVAIMSPASALRAGGLSLPGGQFSLPVMLTPGAGDQVVLLDGGLLLWTDGGIDVVPSGQTTLEMSDAPVSDASVPTAPGAPFVSMWQTDGTAFRLTQYLNWGLATPAAVGVVSGFGAAP